MSRFTNKLKHVKIAAPCAANWDEMFAVAGDRVRYCSQCKLNVYNLSAMSRSEAEALLTYSESRLCVRFYRRADGSILTQNCPIGLRALKRRVSWVAQLLLGMVVGLLSSIGFFIPARKLSHYFAPPPSVMGALALPEDQNNLLPHLRVGTGPIEQGQAFLGKVEQQHTTRSRRRVARSKK